MGRVIAGHAALAAGALFGGNHDGRGDVFVWLCQNFQTDTADRQLSVINKHS